MRKLKKKKKIRRGSKYDPEKTPEQARYICSVYGCTNGELANYLKIDYSTLNKWKEEYPDFRNAIAEGHNQNQNSKVELGLLKRAKGYAYTESTEEVTDDGEKTTVKTKKVKKHLPPDVRAQEVWLYNRYPEKWRPPQYVQQNMQVNMRTSQRDEQRITPLKNQKRMDLSYLDVKELQNLKAIADKVEDKKSINKNQELEVSAEVS